MATYVNIDPLPKPLGTLGGMCYLILLCSVITENMLVKCLCHDGAGCLQDFAASTGLKVNYSKSMMVPINISEQRTHFLAQTFGCSIGSLPFTYLGLPLGLTKPKVEDFTPIVSKCERRLISTSTFLNQAGRLEITNAVFTSLPMIHLCTFRMHKTVIKQID